MFLSARSNQRFVVVRITTVVIVRVGGPNVAAAQESQRNRYITAWFSSFTLAWFFTVFRLTNNLAEIISRSDVLKDSNFNM